MKWLSTKTHRPSIEGTVILRCLNAGTVYFFEGKYIHGEFAALVNHMNGMLLEFTHFIIPDALGIND